MAVKVDISTAYDQVEWQFLQGVILKLGFRNSWVEMVMSCVESITFSFIINGAPRAVVEPEFKSWGVEL